MEQSLLQADDIARDLERLAAELARKKSPADIVEALNKLELEEAAAVLAHLPFDRVVEIFDEQELNDPAGLIMALPEKQAMAVLYDLPADRATDILQRLPHPIRSRFLSLLDPETKKSIEKLLTYPANTAGSLMTTEFVSVQIG